MARRPTRSRSARSPSHGTALPAPVSRANIGITSEPPGQFTGRYLVLLRDNGVEEGLQALKSVAGLKDVCNSADFASGKVEMSEAGESEVFVLDKLKVAVVRADPSQAESLTEAASSDATIMAVEPERIMYALSEMAEPTLRTARQFEYLRGYKDAVNNLYAALTGAAPEIDEAAVAAGYADNAQFTWGLQATRVNQSRFTGRGVRVAVLDTGMDLAHPDFAGRPITNQSFILASKCRMRTGTALIALAPLSAPRFLQPRCGAMVAPQQATSLQARSCRTQARERTTAF